MVAKSDPLAQTMGVLNAVTIDGDAVGALTLVGPGAGGDATASAVAADIADIARGLALPAFGRPVDTLVEAERASMQRHEGGYYIRLSVVDRPGAMAAIATRMGERKISLEAIMQKRAPKDAPSSPYVPVVLITHATTEASIREALDLTVRTASCADAAGHPDRAALRLTIELFSAAIAAVSGYSENSTTSPSRNRTKLMTSNVCIWPPPRLRTVVVRWSATRSPSTRSSWMTDPRFSYEC